MLSFFVDFIREEAFARKERDWGHLGIEKFRQVLIIMHFESISGAFELLMQCVVIPVKLF